MENEIENNNSNEKEHIGTQVQIYIREDLNKFVDLIKIQKGLKKADTINLIIEMFRDSEEGQELIKKGIY